jgi:branched-subunit amino acid ABC-type transport system permease component
MIFGMMNVLNFTHGVLYALGAYFGYLLVKLTGSFWLALVIAPMVVALIGILIEQLSIRPLSDRPHLIQFLQHSRLRSSSSRPFVGLRETMPMRSACRLRSPKRSVLVHSADPVLPAVLNHGGAASMLEIGVLLAKTPVGGVNPCDLEDPEMAALLRVNTRPCQRWCSRAAARC